MNRIVLLALVWLASLSTACTKDGPCDPGKVESFMQVPKDQAILAVHHICKYPEALGAMLKELEQVPDDMRLMIVSKGMTTNMDLLIEVCPAFVQAMKSIAESEAGRKSALLVKWCDLDKLGLAGREKLERAEISRLMVGMLVYQWMQDQEVPEAKKIALRILGI